MKKIELFKQIYDSNYLTNGMLYEMFAQYNGGQIRIELTTTLNSGKKVINVLIGVIDFIITEEINKQDVIKIIWRWCALKSKKNNYYLTNIRAVSLTKHKLEYMVENPNHEDSIIILLLDEDEDEIKANPNGYQVVRIDFVDGNDPNYINFESVKKNSKN